MLGDATWWLGPNVEIRVNLVPRVVAMGAVLGTWSWWFGQDRAVAQAIVNWCARRWDSSAFALSPE